MTTPLPPFSCTYSPELPALLAELNCSLIISTYQAGKVIILSADGDGLAQLPRQFTKPMGLAVAGPRLAVATREEVVILAYDANLGQGYPPAPGKYEGLLAPRTVHFCGELDIHDMAWQGDTLWAVNTRFSCLSTLDYNFSFTPAWRPSFISHLADEDRCHLNGLAVDSTGRPLYVTALGQTDTPRGWRANKTGGGVLIHVPSGEIVLAGLPMPHSPRLIDGHLYLLYSATGELVRADPARGTAEAILRLPGFGRGLARCGDYLFVGMSRLRQGRSLGDIPLAGQDLWAGVAVVSLSRGQLVGYIRYLNDCEEIYDVQVLTGVRRPGLLGLDSPLYRRALSTPEAGFWAQEP